MDVFESIRRRRSVREYRSDPVPPEILERMMEALRLAPSACNYQPWRFIVVADPKIREKLAEASHRQMFVAEAPVVLVGCALPRLAYKKMGETWNSADVDVTIALDHLMLAAASEGLGTCWIGSFDELEVKRLLHVPDDAKVVGLTPLGWPKREGLLRPVREEERKPRSEVIGFERF